MATPRKLPSGSWNVVAQRTMNGRTERRSFTELTKTAAAAAAAAWQNEKRHSHIFGLTVKDAAIRYIDLRRETLSPYTLRDYESYLKQLGSITDSPIDHITNDDIQKLVDSWIREGSSPKTIRNRYTFIRAALMDIRPEYNIRVILPRKVKPDLYTPTDEDIEKLLQLVSGTDLEIPVLLAVFGPMREGEICALTADDIEGNIIHVRRAMVQPSQHVIMEKGPKTYAGYRDIDLGAAGPSILSKIPEKGRVTDFTPRALSQKFRRTVKKHFEKPFVFHSLRHYFASAAHAAQIPDKYIMYRAGWENTSTLDNVYKHVLENRTHEYNTIINNALIQRLPDPERRKPDLRVIDAG